jgi:hypothetical protein
MTHPSDKAWSLLTKTHGGVVSILRDLTLREVQQAYERLDPSFGCVHRKCFYTNANGVRAPAEVSMHYHDGHGSSKDPITLREVFGPIDWDRKEMANWDRWPKSEEIETDPFGRVPRKPKEETDAHRKDAADTSRSASQARGVSLIAGAGSSGTSHTLVSRSGAIIQGAGAGDDIAPDLPAKIVAGEITAWRAWLVWTDGTLHSTATGGHWRPQEALGSDDMPTAGNSSGVHAWKERARAKDYADAFVQSVVPGGRYHPGHYNAYPPQTGVAYGEVELWGTVVEHADGYRAEYAQIKSIAGVAGHSGVTLEQLRTRFGVGGPGPEPAPPLPKIEHRVSETTSLELYQSMIEEPERAQPIEPTPVAAMWLSLGSIPVALIAVFSNQFALGGIALAMCAAGFLISLTERS